MAKMKTLREGETTIVGMACPSGYLSRVIAYGTEDGSQSLKRFVTEALGAEDGVKDEDVRTASRYTWDLGMEDGGEVPVFKAAYWTQNYRRTKSEAADRVAIFACANCGSVFKQPYSAKETLCADCRASHSS